MFDEEEAVYNRDAYGTPLGKPFRERGNISDHRMLDTNLDQSAWNGLLEEISEREDEEARRDDDAAKLWPGGYDNL